MYSHNKNHFLFNSVTEISGFPFETLLHIISFTVESAISGPISENVTTLPETILPGYETIFTSQLYVPPSQKEHTKTA